MPQIFWSLTVAPSFKPNHRVCGQYTIQTILSQGECTQVVQANKKGDNSSKILKIVTRARVKEKDVTDEIAWLKNTCTFREEFCKYVEHHTDIRYLYLVFEYRARTLKEIIQDTNIHISRRHVVEITRQIMSATQHINNHAIYDIDLCPENIQVIDDNIPEWYYNPQAGGFRPRDVLKLSKIRLVYMGKVGNDPQKMTLSERYKSPEHVYDMIITAASNVFSIGCIIAELLLREPLFPVCLPGPWYRREKTCVYDAVLGPFSDVMVQDIERSFKGVFKEANSDFPEFDGVSEEIMGFCAIADPLKYLIIEEFANDIMECMTFLDCSRRIPLPDLYHHPFFDAKLF